MQLKKFKEILDNKVNGNITIYREQVKKLNKKSILDFIEYAQGQGIKRHDTINSIRNIL